MTFGSLFSGIGGFDLGFEQAGMTCAWQVEIEDFPQAVLQTHWPNVPKLRDVCTVGAHNLEPVDLICGGFPCQDLSVAGKRAGLAGSRSGLFWEVVRILGEMRPAWFVLENVPGLFSSDGGRDFGIVLAALDDLGYGVAWRVLNSQFFGVAQRRRRVFLVGSFGRPCPGEILFESEGGSGDTAAGGEAGPEIAEKTGGRPKGEGWCAKTHPALTTRDYKSVRCDVEEPGFIVGTVQCSFAKQNGTDDAASGYLQVVGAPTDALGVREFAGLPKGMDRPRYKALGNAVTVSVARWIGERINGARNFEEDCKC